MSDKDSHKDSKGKPADKNQTVKSPDELNDESLGKVSGGGSPFGFKPNLPGKNPGARGGGRP